MIHLALFAPVKIVGVITFDSNLKTSLFKLRLFMLRMLTGEKSSKMKTKNVVNKDDCALWTVQQSQLLLWC